MIRIASTLLLFLALAACTTMPIANTEDIGYRNVAQSQGAQVYLCNSASCGDFAVGVHKTEPMTSQEAAEFTTGLETDTAERLVKIALEQEFASRGENVTVSRVRATEIGGFEGAEVDLILRSNDGDRLNGGLVILQNSRNAEIFAVITEGASRARNEARKFATFWSRTQ